VNRAGTALLVLLLLQLALVAKLYWGDRAAELSGGGVSVSDIGPFLIDEIRISDGHGAQAILTKTDNRWTLPGQGGLPANSTRIDQLIEQLTFTDPGWPVAHTLPARQRFQVAHYHFRRRIELWAQGESISTVFLGTSPGFRKVHARNNAKDEIYSISLNLHETATSADQWLDQRLLQVRGPLGIVSENYRLDRSGGDWHSEDGATPDARELEALLAALRSLQVTGLASEDARDKLAFAEAALILQVESLSGPVTLELYALGDQRYIISSAFDLPFKLSPYSFDQLTGIDAQLLSGAQ
jgi:uncharacterized protein DUF4340